MVLLRNGMMVMMMVMSSNAVEINTKTQQDAQLNAKEESMLRVLPDLVDIGFSQGEYPYHSFWHSKDFARGAALYATKTKPTKLESNGGGAMTELQTNNRRYVAEFFGGYHDTGYKVANGKVYKKEGGYGNLWENTETKRYVSDPVNQKCGIMHELQSVKDANTKIGTLKTEFAKSDEAIDQQYKPLRILGTAHGQQMGHALIAGTKGTGAPGQWKEQLEIYNEGFGVEGQPAKITAEGEDKDKFADFMSKLNAITHADFGAITAKDMFEGAGTGDFSYMWEKDGICQIVNLFTEFFLFGGVGVNGGGSKEQGAVWKEFNQHLGGEKNFEYGPDGTYDGAIAAFGYQVIAKIPERAYPPSKIAYDDWDNQGTGAIIKKLVEKAEAVKSTTIAALKKDTLEKVPEFMAVCEFKKNRWISKTPNAPYGDAGNPLASLLPRNE